MSEREQEDGRDESGSQSGGQSGQIAFHDFIGTVAYNRDELPPDEMKRILWKHGELSENNIKKQKAKREQYKAIKNGDRMALAAHRAGLSTGMEVGVQPHPVLSQKFSGHDPNMNPHPDENVTDTNNEKKEELRLQARPENVLKNTPRYNPSSTPRPAPF